MTTQLATLTNDTFDEEIRSSDRVVLVDVWAEWCPPCKAVEPVLASIAELYRDQVQVYKINSDEHPEVLVRFGVMGLPTLLVFRDGELVKRLVGARGQGHLVQELDEYLT